MIVCTSCRNMVTSKGRFAANGSQSKQPTTADFHASGDNVDVNWTTPSNAVIEFISKPAGSRPSFSWRIVSARLAAAALYPQQAIYSYPVPQEPGASRILPNRIISTLKEIPTTQGLMDVTRLPLSGATEELLQISECKPPFVLRYPEQHADVSLDWNAEELPDALLWICNVGREHEPWSGRHFAVGVEPANSFFDVRRVAIPPANHPLSGRSGLVFKAGMPRTISYRLSVRAL